MIPSQLEATIRQHLPPRIVLEAAGEGAATLVPAIQSCIDEIGPGGVLEVVVGLDAIPTAIGWCIAHGVDLLHLTADRRGGRFWVRRGGA